MRRRRETNRGGAGHNAESLSATTPFSPAESLLFRAQSSGNFYAAVGIGTTSAGAVGAGAKACATTTSGGSTQYQVVPAPAGASIPGTALPLDRATITVSGQKYYLFGNTFYRSVATSGTTNFVAVTKPAGIVTVKAVKGGEKKVNPLLKFLSAFWGRSRG